MLFREVRIDRSEGGKLVGRRGDDDVAVNAEKGRGNAPSPLPPFALRPSSASSLLHRLSLSLSLFPTRLFQGLITPRSVTPPVKLSLIWTNENACILQPPVHTLFPHAPRASYALDETRPPRNNNSNFLSPRNSRSTRPLLITRTYAPASSPYVIHSLFPLVQNRKKISNSDLSAAR